MLESQFGPMTKDPDQPSLTTTTTPTSTTTATTPTSTTVMYHRHRQPPLINTSISSLLPYVSTTHRATATPTMRTNPTATTTQAPPNTPTLKDKLHKQWRQRFKRTHRQQIPQPPSTQTIINPTTHTPTTPVSTAAILQTTNHQTYNPDNNHTDTLNANRFKPRHRRQHRLQTTTP